MNSATLPAEREEMSGVVGEERTTALEGTALEFRSEILSRLFGGCARTTQANKVANTITVVMAMCIERNSTKNSKRFSLKERLSAEFYSLIGLIGSVFLWSPNKIVKEENT